VPKRISTVPMSDFQGGLNLNADPFQLNNNETSDCLNVDFDPLGGFVQRDAAVRINSTQLASAVPSMWGFYTPSGSTRQVIAQQGQSIAYSNDDGVTFTAVGTGSAPWSTAFTGSMRAATFRNPQSLGTSVSYIQRAGNAAPIRWDGTTGTALSDPSTAGWSETIGTRTHGKMPKAKFITAHRSFIFVANTTETIGGSETNQSSRIRWSHEQFPEDWRSDDYIDVESGAGDAITGIASWRDGLLVFTNNAVFLIRGFGQTTFEVVNLSRTIGAVSQDAVAVCENGVFFFSWPEGVYFYDGSRIQDMFYNLRPMLEDGTVDRTKRSMATLSWLKQRLYLSLPTDATYSGNTETYVYDPALNARNKQGGWTRYQFNGRGLGVGFEYTPPSYDSKWIVLSYAEGRRRMIALHQDADQDNLTGTAIPVITRYRTSWVDLGNPALVKSWRRPVFVMRRDVDYQLSCTGFRDYDYTNVGGTFFLTSSTGNGTDLVWDVGLWNVGSWVYGEGLPQGIERGSRLGRATAVSLQIAGPTTTSVRWGINSITWKYIPKRVRS
jgi:hypothetical protein